MIKTFTYFVAILTFLSLLISCNESSLGIEENVNLITEDSVVIKPLKIGNYWEYEITRFDEDGSVNDTHFQTNTISKDTIINNETLFVERQVSDNIVLFKILINKDDGLWQDSSNGTRLVPYPVNIGEEFLSRTYQRNTDTYEIFRKVSEVRKIIDVPAGTFICIEYIDRSVMNGVAQMDTLNILYYSPKYGLIKTLRFTTAESGKPIVFEKHELKEFEIK